MLGDSQSQGKLKVFLPGPSEVSEGNISHISSEATLSTRIQTHTSNLLHKWHFVWSRLWLCFSSLVLVPSPPVLIWEPVSCSTPALEFFPMSVHTSNTSWQAQRSLLRIPIRNNYSVSYMLADLFPEHYALSKGPFDPSTTPWTCW